MLAKFLQKNKDSFTPEQFIYLQLCSKEALLQQKAVDYIKDNYNVGKLNIMHHQYNYL